MPVDLISNGAAQTSSLQTISPFLLDHEKSL